MKYCCCKINGGKHSLYQRVFPETNGGGLRKDCTGTCRNQAYHNTSKVFLISKPPECLSLKDRLSNHIRHNLHIHPAISGFPDHKIFFYQQYSTERTTEKSQSYCQISVVSWMTAMQFSGEMFSSENTENFRKL